MLLDSCILDGDVFFSAPLVRAEAEEEWTSALNSGAIPNSLFNLYRDANFLSLGSAPSFLKDDQKVLFSYFSLLLRSIMEAMVDAKVQLASFAEAQTLTYDIGKKIKGENWDPTADSKARRHFRDLIIALHSSLDSFADLAALFFPGYIPGLKLGRGQFSRIESWLKRPFPAFGFLITPYDQPLKDLYDTLNPLVIGAGPETDWLPLMRLLRNKAEHLGQPMFRQIGLHDATPKFYTFIPRQWPFIWEKHIEPKGQPVTVDPGFIPKFFRETLIHQDIVSFASGLRKKVQILIGGGIQSLCKTYAQVAGFGLNQAALAELRGNSETYNFEYFLDA